MQGSAWWVYRWTVFVSDGPVYIFPLFPHICFSLIHPDFSLSTHEVFSPKHPLMCFLQSQIFFPSVSCEKYGSLLLAFLWEFLIYLSLWVSHLQRGECSPLIVRAVLNMACSVFANRVTRALLPVIVALILAGSLCSLWLAFHLIT